MVDTNKSQVIDDDKMEIQIQCAFVISRVVLYLFMFKSDINMLTFTFNLVLS